MKTSILIVLGKIGICGWILIARLQMGVGNS